MLCVDCKENVAVIFIKDGTHQIGLCADCAKKRGIDPMKAMMDQFSKNPAFNMENLTKQIDKLMSEMDPEELEKLSNAPFMAFNFEDLTKMQNEDDAAQDEKENVSSDKKDVKKKSKKTKTLDTFGINLTEKARSNELDIVIGRDRELQRMIQILNRRSKNNPALIGEPGVGKTALVNALAIKIANGDVPAKLIDKELYLLDMTSLMAGTQFRGQFEARVKGIIDECKACGNIILAIDEVHNIVGGQEHDNSMNAANMLKPALANGYVQLIGATTLKEYRKYIEKDTALERRFQTVIIDEPTEATTIEILKGIRPYYENYHKVKIPDEALEKAVELSVKYIHDRFLPDKAIDLMDEAASRVNLDDKVLAEITKTSFELSTLEEALSRTEEEQQLSNENNADLNSNVDSYEKAAILKENICKLKTTLDELNKKARKNIVTDDHLAKVVELWTKIPVSKIKTSDKEKLLHLEKHLNEKIIGQEEATHDISAAIIRRRAGLQNIVKPPSFIFVGPTGVGKTALVKALAYELFDSEDAVIKLDMSEYSESHSTSKLIGAPPGYVGYDEAGQLTEKVRRNPYSIILFDEIEKAHSSIYNVLLQILDEGILTDAQGKSVSFKHTVIVMTSNLGTNFKNDSYGFANDKIEKDTMKKHVTDSMKDFFTPEFLNRVDETIIFNKLDKENINKITKLMLNEFVKDTSKKGFEFTFTDNVIHYISKIGFDSKFGARPLKRAIQKNIEDVLAVKLFEGKIKTNKKYTIDYINNELIIV